MYTHIYAHTHATTINEKKGLQESEERDMEGVKGGEGRGDDVMIL